MNDIDFDGVHLVQLDTITDSAEITGAVARDLNLTLLNDVDATTQLLDYLDGRNSLLLFDNCEHVLRDAADLIGSLLSRCATLKVLATSRESLDMRGETVWRAPALPSPSAATELFLRVANKRSGVSFDTPLNRTAIADICDMLDGLPLAFELAAARTSMSSVEQIGTMLRDFLQTLYIQGRHHRQRSETLGDVVRWSYELLDDQERFALRRLAVFNGGFALQDAPALINCDEQSAWDLVDALIARSLLDTRTDADGAPRFAMLNTIRAFGLAQLVENGEMQAISERHCRHFVKLAERARHPFLPDPGIAKQHRTELSNLLAVANWAAHNNHSALAARIATVSVIELDWQGEFVNGIRWSRDVCGNSDELAFNTLVTESYLRGQENILSQESALAQEAVELAGDRHFRLLSVAICLSSLSDVVTSPAAALRRVDQAYQVAATAPQPHFSEAFIDVHAALFDLFKKATAATVRAAQGLPGRDEQLRSRARSPRPRRHRLGRCRARPSRKRPSRRLAALQRSGASAVVHRYRVLRSCSLGPDQWRATRQRSQALAGRRFPDPISRPCTWPQTTRNARPTSSTTAAVATD